MTNCLYLQRGVGAKDDLTEENECPLSDESTCFCHMQGVQMCSAAMEEMET